MFLFEFVAFIFILMCIASLFVILPILVRIINSLGRIQRERLEKAARYKHTPEERRQEDLEVAEREYQEALRKRVE